MNCPSAGFSSSGAERRAATLTFVRLLPLVTLAALLSLPLGSCCPRQATKPQKPDMCHRQQVEKPSYTKARRLPKCVKLRMIQARTYKPSNVQVMFQALSCAGEPVIKMERDDFIVREARTSELQGSKISIYESQQTILPYRIGSKMYLMLLLDMSGSVQKSRDGVRYLKTGARKLVNHLHRNQAIAVAVFDGSEEIHLVQDYTSDIDLLRKAVDSLSSWKEKDPSTNLYGAYIKGLQNLQSKMATNPNRFTRGMLFLLTDGKDQADRKTLKEALCYRGKLTRGCARGPVLAQPSKYTVFAIGLTGEFDKDKLKMLADKNSYFGFRKGWQEFTSKRVEGLARRLDRVGRSFHVLSYCSPKRRRRHRVQIEVSPNVATTLSPAAGGRIQADFDATGFGPGCDADQIINKFAECGIPGRSCQTGFRCDKREYRCISNEEDAAAKRQRAQEISRRTAVWYRRKGVAEAAFVACKTMRARHYREELARYNLRNERILKSDCGPRFLFEGGMSLYPAPLGVGGAILFGYSFPGRAEWHFGVGFGPPVYLFVTQLRINLYTWKYLDVFIAPRFSAGGSVSDTVSGAGVVGLSLMAGVRFRLGKHFALYAKLGPGLSHTYWDSGGDRPFLKKTSFILPGWLGTELRW